MNSKCAMSGTGKKNPSCSRPKTGEAGSARLGLRSGSKNPGFKQSKVGRGAPSLAQALAGKSRPMCAKSRVIKNTSNLVRLRVDKGLSGLVASKIDGLRPELPRPNISEESAMRAELLRDVAKPRRRESVAGRADPVRVGERTSRALSKLRKSKTEAKAPEQAELLGNTALPGCT